MKINRITFFLVILTTLSLQLFGQATTTLDGSKSTNFDTCHWKQISGKDIVLGTPDSIKCLATFLETGIYKFELWVGNAFGEARDTLQITVIKGALSLPDGEIYKPPARPKQIDIAVVQQAGILKVKIASPKFSKINYELFDVVGRRLYKKELTVQLRDNYFELPIPQQNGIYIIRFWNDFDVWTQKIFVGRFM